MKPKTVTVAAAIAGALAGGALTLSLPAPGGPPDTGPAQTPARAETAIPRTDAQTLLAWTPRQLPAGYAHAARRIDGVEAAAEVRSGVVWVNPRPDGLALPLEVAAVDVGEYAAFVPPGERALFAELETGVALTASPRGDVLDTRAGSVAVRGVVDPGLIGAHEAVVSLATGERLGVTRPRYLLVALRPGADAAAVESALRDAAPSGTRVRVRAPGETPAFRHGDAVLAPSRLKALFGEFYASGESDGSLRIDPAWVGTQIVTTKLAAAGSMRCHRAIVPQLGGAFEEIARRGMGGLITVGGCFSPRFLNHEPEAGISHHSWGVAFDLNVEENPYGAEPRLDPRVVDVLERWGFTWGGRWLVPDGMHFEFLRYAVLKG